MEVLTALFYIFKESPAWTGIILIVFTLYIYQFIEFINFTVLLKVKAIIQLINENLHLTKRHQPFQ